MLRATPIRREANHEDAVVLDLDRIADVAGEDMPVDDRLVNSAATSLGTFEIQAARYASIQRSTASVPIAPQRTDDPWSSLYCPGPDGTLVPIV